MAGDAGDLMFPVPNTNKDPSASIQREHGGGEVAPGLMCGPNSPARLLSTLLGDITSTFFH